MDQKYRCNLCTGAKFVPRDQLADRIGCDRQKYNIVKCKKCGLHSLFPIPTDTEVEDIYKNYAIKGNRIAVEEFRMNNIYPRKIQIIRKYIMHTGDILDIGAGLGGFSIIARCEGYNVTGIEPEKEQCNLAKNLFDADLICRTFDQFKRYDTLYYDAVHMHHVLEHLQNPKGTLVDVRHKLKENGVLILEVPNQFFVLKTELHAKLGKKKFNKSKNPYHHIFFFSPYTLKRMVVESGFEILELNNLSKDTEKSSLKNKIHHVLSSMLRMGTSSRIEVVARRSKML